MRPVEISGPDIFDLGAVGYKGIGGNGVAFRSRGKMNADPATLEPVSAKRVLIRIIDKDAFGFSVLDRVALNDGTIGVIQQDTMVAIVDGAVAPDHQVFRKHKCIADMIAFGYIAADFAVVRIHVVNRDTNISKAVVPENVVPARRRENSIAAIAEIIVLDNGTGRVS